MDLAVSMGAISVVIVVGWITPGPNMFAVMAASLQHGRRHGLATAAGLTVATLVWVSVAVLGVAIIFELFPRAFVTLKLMGAGYLIWLGIKSIKQVTGSNNTAKLKDVGDQSLVKTAANGFLISLGNPKAALFFGSVFTSFLPAGAPNWFLAGVIVFCCAFSFVLHAVTATVFSTDIALRTFTKLQKQITLAFGALFIAMGGGIIYAALRRT